MQRLIRQGYFVVGIPSFDTPPFYFEKDGELQGSDISFMRNLASELELEVRFNRDSSRYDELIARTALNEFDVAIGKLSTPMSRLKKLHTSPDYILLKQALLIDRTKLLALGGKDALSIQNILKNEPISIGLIGGSAHERWAKINFPNAEIIGYPSWTDAINAVATEEVFSIYRDEGEIKKIMLAQPQLSIKLKSVLLSDLDDNKAIYVSRANPQLAEIIDRVLMDSKRVWTTDRLIDEFRDIYTDPAFASK